MTDTPLTTSTAPGRKLDKQDRFEAYLQVYKPLKERGALREVVERELLLEFIRVNQPNINEFPLLAKQQESITNIIAARGEHPAYEFIGRLLSNFMHHLVLFEKALINKDNQQQEESETDLANIEAQMVRLVQGTVYSVGLVTDNFEELMLRYFGEAALTDYNALIEEHTLDQSFWKAMIEHFVAKQVQAAYDDIIARERYTLVKDGANLVIRFQFDDVLARLNPTTQAIEKTRIQTGFEGTFGPERDKETQQYVHGALLKGLSFIPDERLSESEVAFITRVVCIDPSMSGLKDEYLAGVGESKRLRQARIEGDEEAGEELERQRKQLQFTSEQVTAAGIGAAIAVSNVRENFIRALNAFTPGQADAVRGLVQQFDLSSLERILFYLLENHFLYLLKEKGRDEGGKVMVRAVKTPRAAKAEVAALEQNGLNRIRKKRLFAPDPDKDDMLLFKVRSRKELVGTVRMLQLEDQLAARVVRLFASTRPKVDLQVVIDMKQVARTTTNLKAKIAEILAAYGTLKG